MQQAGALCERVMLGVMAKVPIAGQVKTRLAKATGDQFAADFALACLQDTWSKVSSLPSIDPVLFLLGDRSELDLQPSPNIVPQANGDLGTKMARAIRHGLCTHPAVILIGTDSPQVLGTQLLSAARHLLTDSDAVLGPAEDGGYYLIGLKHCPADLLDDLPLGSARALEATRERLLSRGFRVKELDLNFDVDELEDLSQLDLLLQATPERAPQCAALLGRPRGTPLATISLPPDSASSFPAERDQSVSVIIPILNEAKELPGLLSELRDHKHQEAIFIDGGSSDGSQDIVRQASDPRVRLLEAPLGRSIQLNAGARAAGGRLLLFLHADVSLPVGAIQEVRRILNLEGVVLGAFRTWTVPEVRSQDGFRFAPWLHLADMRSRYTELPYGDQAMFMTKEWFVKSGGYPEQPLMEDLELSRRLARRGQVVTSPQCVRVSGRRFVQKPIRYCIIMNTFPALYRLGVSANALARLYHHVR